jgi:transaldolase
VPENKAWSERITSVTSKLEQLKSMTVLVSDTGDINAIKDFHPTDSTTNPSLILKAAELPAYAGLVDDALKFGKASASSRQEAAAIASDRLVISFGIELTKIVPGRVSTEVDADLSFDTTAMIGKARKIIAAYEERGVGKDRILVKLASTWEGVRAAEVLQKEGIDCNMTLLFSLVQAAASAEAGAFLISPFVGRIYDWYVKATGQQYTPQTDPGVLSVERIYRYYKALGYKTVVMGASFRSKGQIEALAGCDRLTISPSLLAELAKDDGKLERRLYPDVRGEKPAKLKIDEISFRLQLNEDAMATEKLAEGIRIFAKDLRTLRAFLADRIN